MSSKVEWDGETLVVEVDGKVLRIPAGKVGDFLDALLEQVCIDCAGPLTPPAASIN